MTPGPAPHSRLHLLQYSLIATPLAFAALPVYLHAPEFYASELGVSIGALGVALLALRIVDAVQDPVIGILSDRWHRRRRQVMLLGLALLALGFWMVFHPSAARPVAWFAVSIFICTTGFSIVSINFQALGGLWQSTAAERTRVTGWREAFGLAGLLLAALAPTMLGKDDDARQAFHLLALLYQPLLAVAFVALLIWLRQATIQAPAAGAKPLPIKLLRSGWNLRFFAIYTCNAFASSIPAVLVLFFINDRLEAERLTGLFLMLYFASGASAMPLWQWLAKALGKERAWLCGMWLAVTTFIWAFTLGSGDTTAYAAVCVLSGLALGADLALPPAIIADQIERRKDYGLASCYFSTMTFLTKAALALATGISLPLLELLGYQPGAVTDYGVTDHLSHAYALAPSLLKALTALWLWHFIHFAQAGEHQHEEGGIANERIHIP